jgi:hypothetical protein
MKRKLIITSVMLFCFTIAFAIFAGIDGKWTGVAINPEGDTVHFNYTFKTNNGKLTGLALANENTFNIFEGKVKEDSLSFAVLNDDGEKILNKGKYYSVGDSIGLNFFLRAQKVHIKLKRVYR